MNIFFLFFSILDSNFLEPVELIGEGKYNLNAMKEIKVTESFLELDMKDKGCQIEESSEDCKSKHYVDTLLQHCKCLPLSISTSKNVSLISYNL